MGDRSLARYLVEVALVPAALAAGQAGAVDVQVVDVSNRANTYKVRFDVLIDADARLARALMTDYRQWPRLSRTIAESHSLGSFADGQLRVKLRFHSCILGIFCRDVWQVKDIETGSDKTAFRTVIVPGQSDFASGRELWEFVAAGGGRTRLRYEAELVIAFSVPPLLGPWLVRRELRKELYATAVKLEQIAAPSSTTPPAARESAER